MKSQNCEIQTQKNEGKGWIKNINSENEENSELRDINL